MRKPAAEVIRIMMTLIILGCLEDEKPNSEMKTLRDTHKLDSCNVLIDKKRQLNKRCGALITKNTTTIVIEV